MAFTRPSNIFRFAWEQGNDVSDKAEPDEAKKTLGHVKEKPKFRTFNWLWNNLSQWVPWLDQQEQAHTAELADHESRIVYVEGGVSNLNGRVQTLETASANHEGRITQNESDISSHSSTLSNHEGRISANESDISSIDGRVTSNESDISALDVRVSQNESDISSLQPLLSVSGDSGAVTANDPVTGNDSAIWTLVQTAPDYYSMVVEFLDYVGGSIPRVATYVESISGTLTARFLLGAEFPQGKRPIAYAGVDRVFQVPIGYIESGQSDLIRTWLPARIVIDVTNSNTYLDIYSPNGGVGDTVYLYLQNLDYYSKNPTSLGA